MRRLLHTLAMAALVAAAPIIASADTNLNLDAGTTGSSGGDITFGTSGIAPVGSAQLSDLTTLFGAEFSTLILAGPTFESLLATETYSTAPIGPSSLVTNEVIAVKTNGGNYAAVLVTAVSGSSI